MMSSDAAKDKFNEDLHAMLATVQQADSNQIKSTSATPASDPTTTTTPKTDNNFIDAPPPTITNIILPPPLPAPITVMNTTCPTPATPIATSDYLPPATSPTTTAPSTSSGDSALACPHCDRIFTSHIGLVGQLRIHCTETDELVPGATTHSRNYHLQCLHCPRAFTHRIGLLGYISIHESGTHPDAKTSCAPTIVLP
ncbi:unnamed protein product [Schistocephalus solidus]|uniref:C2H2-type domain-containing protein n=1 Tax=Schistocephalus solidus TaxID=70667 RepID=A0A183SV03_SCHSO|nr:unnamed protein product [Schistocephalus solidus]